MKERSTRGVADLLDNATIIEYLLFENRKLKQEVEYEKERSDRWEKLALISYRELHSYIQRNPRPVK